MNRITITIYGNERIIGIHTKTIMDANPYSYDSKPKSKRLASFIKRLNAIPGINRAEVRRYEVSIEKADAFDWKEVVPLAIPVIAKFCRYDQFELRIEDQRPTHRYDEDGFMKGVIIHNQVDLGVEPSNPYA